MTQTLPSLENYASDSKRINASLRTAQLTLVAAFTQVGLYAYFAVTLNSWQMWILTGILAAFILSNLASIWMIRHERLETGGWLVIGGIAIGVASISLLLSGISVILGFLLIVLTMVLGFQMLPTKRLIPLFAASLVAGGLTGILDLLPLEYRLYLPAMQTIVTAISAVFVLTVGFLILPQVANQIQSLQLKISIWTGSVIAIVVISVVIYTTIAEKQNAVQSAENEALSLAQAQAESVRVETEVPLNTARAIAQALTSLKSPAVSSNGLSRDQVNAMLRQILAENPAFLGTYTLWEPNAFDGLDAQFRNTEAHDQTGRFIPYWIRGDDGNITVTALLDYETPGIGDWYLLPRQTKTEVAIAPLIYPINGVDTVMASFVVPILYNDKFYGIAGVDAPIGFVQNIVDGVDLYNGAAQAVIMTGEGTLIGVRNKPELTNQPASEVFPDFADLQERLTAGDTFISASPNGNYLRVFAPIDLGRTGKHWSFALIIPISRITASANRAALLEGVIGVTLLLISLALLWFLSNQIARPVRTLTHVANEVSQGNLNIQADVQAPDETGILANAFNLMINQLGESFSTLEQRVADRTRNLVLAAEVGRAVSQVRDLDSMLRDACEMILKEFDLYYVQVYLTDPTNSTLKLEAGTGSVGVQLLERRHSLALDSQSLNGRAAMEKHPVVIPDTSKSATFRPNALLPETRGEMAVPLLVADKVVGVLDMQSSQPGVLTEEVLPAFEALAGQLAVAVQNANLLAETEEARAQVEKQARRLVREGWNEELDAIHKPERLGYVFDQDKVIPLAEADESQLSEGLTAVSVPIEMTGEPLGSLVVELANEARAEQSAELISIVARQVAQQVENLRLLESAERYRLEAERAARLQTVEGWKNYMDASGEKLAYMYNMNEVIPVHEGLPPNENSLRLPLKVQNEAIGALTILGVEPRDTEAADLANTISDRLSAHIEGLRLNQQTQVSLAETQALYRINEAIGGETDIETIYHTVAKLVCNEIGFDGSWIAIYEPDKEAVRGVAGVNIPEDRLYVTLPIDQKFPALLAVRTRQLVTVNNPEQDERMSDVPADLRPALGKTLSVPIMSGQELLGVIGLTRTESAADIGSREERMIQAIANQLATVMQRVKLFEQLRKQADREAMLNAINQKIQSATSVEAVLQIAARELGHALGAPMTIAQLSLKSSTS